MKNSKLHQDARGLLESISEKSIGIIINDKEKLEKTLKWIEVQNQFLKNLSCLTENLPAPSERRHHYIEENIYKTLTSTKQAVLNMAKPLRNKNVDEVIQYIYNCNTQILTAKDVIKLVSSQLEEFLNELESGINKNPPKNCEGAIQHGANTHILYLQYMKSINDNGLQYLQQAFYQKLMELDEQIVNSINLIWTSMNQSAIKHYHSPDTLGFSQLCPNNKDILTTQSLTAQSYHNSYFTPVFDLEPVTTFSDATVKMRATENFEGDKVGELKLELNEVVDVINSSYADWYKVRNCKGVEGFVPVSCLIPIKK